ncbi:MAG: fibronectin type III domain-containing protein, partial [Anaerolineales bacterium]
MGNLSINYLDLSYNALQDEFPASLAGLDSYWVNGLKLEGNLVEANDPTTRSQLDLKDPNWARTQTWAPADLNIGAISTQTVTLVWTPIEFRQGDGGYAIEVAEQAAGPFQQVTETASKADSSFQVSGLKPDTDYYFRVRTHTTPYDRQQNDLW